MCWKMGVPNTQRKMNPERGSLQDEIVIKETVFRVDRQTVAGVMLDKLTEEKLL